MFISMHYLETALISMLLSVKSSISKYFKTKLTSLVVYNIYQLVISKLHNNNTGIQMNQA